jgi:hypothetical protein
MIRRFRPSAVTVLLFAGAFAACMIVPAAATGEARAPASRPVNGLQIHLSGAALAAAAWHCARWASDAGFSNDGYLTGGLTIAVAVALAESGCSPRACWDDTRSRPCSEHTERARDSVDRGAWQLNSRAWRSVSNRCAFSGPCAADMAYLRISAVGTFFAPWTTYSEDIYAHYLWAAQQAVNGLQIGTVTSALAGSCLGYPRDRTGIVARLENCGTAAGQTWRVVGSALHTPAGLCLAATARRRPAIVRLARCSRSRLEQWRTTQRHQLYNPAARRCLSDPSGGDRPGVLVTATTCATSRQETWFRP